MAALNSLLYVLLTSILTSPPEYTVTTEVTQDDIDPRCPPNEVPRKCETHCGSDGNHLGTATICPEVCIHDCVCKPGFVRGRHGSCIKPQHYSTLNDEQELQQDIDPL